MPSVRRRRSVTRSAALVVALVGLGLPPRSAAADHAPPPVDLVVDTFADSFDGSCADGDCSLRDAVADADPGDVIGIPAGLFVLSLSGTGGIGEGDVDLQGDVVIAGIGDTGTFIDASAIDDHAFEISGGADVSLERLTIFPGRIAGRGAAVAVDGATATLDSLTVQGGRARNGGAIAVTDASVVLRQSVVLDAIAVARGGGLSVHGASTVELIATTIAGARAKRGGAIWFGGSGELHVDRSTLARNGAAKGGAILVSDGSAFVHRSTIARNTARTAGAMVADAPIRPTGSAIGENRSDAGPPCVGMFRHGGRRGGGNVGTRGTRSCGLGGSTDRIVRDLGLGPLASHGGPTPTIPLLPSSPAVDAGSACREPDQRGARRDRACDAGAYELVRCVGRIVNVVGTRHDDELSGGRMADGIIGQAGDDELQGSIGVDGVCGGRGSDRLYGGPGDDRLHASWGDDRLHGEDGDDRLVGGNGDDIVIGGPGRDVCLVERRDEATRSCEIVRELPSS